MTTFKALRELITFKGGGTPSKQVAEYWNGDIPWATVKDFTSTSLSETQDFISLEGLKNSSANLIQKGHVIIPTRMSLGKAAINTVDLAINQDLRALVPKVPLDTRFLLHAVLSLKEEILRKGSGATVKGITQDELYKLEIAFPPLDDQIRIAHLLGKVEGLIAQRKQHLQQLDDLLKSVFLDMFGDPVRNEKGWEKKPLEMLGSVNRGVSKHRPRNAPELLGGMYPLIQTGEVSNAGIYITSYSQTYSDLGFAQSKLWPSGTLCITIAANIAQTSILTFDACFPDSIVGFNAFKGEANVLYIHGLFWFFQKILEKNAPAAAQKNINLEILRTLEVPKPPIELQNQFAAIVENIESVKSRYQQSLTDLEALYGALSQQAFKGKLDLSRVPLPNQQGQPTHSEHNEEQEQAGRSPLSAEAITPTEVINHLMQAAQPQGRSELLARWLRQYLTNTSPDASLGSAQLLEGAWQTLQEAQLETNGETPALTLDDYDALKDLVFKALASGELNQTFDGDSNRVALQKRPVNWGTW